MIYESLHEKTCFLHCHKQMHVLLFLASAYPCIQLFSLCWIWSGTPPPKKKKKKKKLYVEHNLYVEVFTNYLHMIVFIRENLKKKKFYEEKFFFTEIRSR